MIHHSVPEKSNQATAKLLHVPALVDSWFTLKAPRQGKHWNLDHPIYKKYRPAAAWLHLIHCQWMLPLLSDALSFINRVNEVMSCIADNCPGTLCLDVDSGPKWQIDCNICHILSLAISMNSLTGISKNICTIWQMHGAKACNSSPFLRIRLGNLFGTCSQNVLKIKVFFHTFHTFSYTFFASVEQAHKIKATADFCDESLVKPEVARTYNMLTGA